MTPEERAVIEESILREARTDFALYCEMVHNGLWKPYRHVKYLCDILERVERGEIRKLIITMPPQFGKSMTVSETFPSWFVGRDPERRVIEVSYSDEFARKFGGNNLRKIKALGKRIFGVEIDSRRSSDSNWQIAGHRGGMISAGILGGVTGQGADLLLLDDPIKNWEEANSEVYREKLWTEWQMTLRSRVHPDGIIIVILTRWHEDDIIGRIMSSTEKNDWTLVRIPCEAEDEDPLGRARGDVLWPEGKHDSVWLASQKIASGPYAWESQYQGNPTAPGGEIIKKQWWRFYNFDPRQTRFDELVQSWDMSFKDTKASSRVSGQVWGRIGANCYLCDEITELLDFPGSIKAVITLTGKWPRATKKYIEDKANGPAIIATLKNKIPGLIAVEPEGGKVARAYAVTGLMESRNVFLPDPLSDRGRGTHDFIQECSAFPRGKYADRVDAMTQALVKWVMVVARDPRHEPTLDEAGTAGETHIDDSFGLGNTGFVNEWEDSIGDLFG